MKSSCVLRAKHANSQARDRYYAHTTSSPHGIAVQQAIMLLQILEEARGDL